MLRQATEADAPEPNQVTSLDGYIARPDGDITWLTDPVTGPRHAKVTSNVQALEWNTFFPEIDHLVMGRGTYEKVLTFDKWPYTGKQVIVLSTTLTTTDDRITRVNDLDQAVRALDASGARQVYVDGGKVIQAFLSADLIDEITIGRAPVLIGQGIPLFGYLDHDRTQSSETVRRMGRGPTRSLTLRAALEPC